jgi:hypothetical protein
MELCEENHEACYATHGPQLDKLLSVFRSIDCEQALSGGELQVICSDGIPMDSKLIFPVADSVLVCGREKLML